MAVEKSTPNIVVDENFLMLEKRLRRRYSEKATIYSNADAMEQERSGARAYAIAPEAYGDSKFIGGISFYQNGADGNNKYMTTEDYVAYFERCHDTFGAMNFDTVAPAEAKEEDEPRVLVNRKNVELIHREMVRACAAENRRAKSSSSKRSSKSAVKETKIEGGKLDAFFQKLSSVKGRAFASVAALAVCCTVAVGGVMAGNSAEPINEGSLDRVRMVEPVQESVIEADDEAHGSLLSTLE